VLCEAVRVSDIAVEGVASGAALTELGDAAEGVLTITDTAEVEVDGVRARLHKGSSSRAAALTVALLADRLAVAEGTRATVTRCALQPGARLSGLVLQGFAHTEVAGNHVQSPPEQAAMSGLKVRGAEGGRVRVHDNVVRVVGRGLEVSLGRKDGLSDGSRGCLDVQRNELQLEPKVPGADPSLGIAVRGAQQVVVSGNRIGCDHPEAWFAGLHGLELEGAFGPQLLVRDNLFDGCRVGIRFDPDRSPAYHAWVFQCNVALAREKPDVLNLPPDVADIVDEHNRPPDGRRPT
jgi:hypothetical protein